MPLITDYRPKTFKEFIGSTITVKAIKANIRSEQKTNAYLLTGGSGCGKTTMGRIIARSLGAASKHNFVEMDSSQFTGIDHIRNIKKVIWTAPVGGEAKRIWLLDECHQLSKPAQEALLKMLEETPRHVHFILCTTDPQKLRETLRRRCAWFILDPVPEDDICNYMKYVCRKEKKRINKSMLEVLAQQSNGSIGIALGLLNTVIELDSDEVDEQLKNKVIITNEAIDLCRLLFTKPSWKDVAEVLRGLKKNGAEPETVRKIMLGYCSSILLKGKKDPMAYLVMECFSEPFYQEPYSQLIMACYDVIEGE